MSKEPFALSTISPSSLEEESDYDTICATVMESARGRWFLEEYARRNRNADTRLVLAAIERIDRLIRSDRSPQADRGIRSDLLEMVRTIAQTRAESMLDAGAQAGPMLPEGSPADESPGTNEAPSLSDAESRGGPTANLIPAVEFAIVEPTRSLETTTGVPSADQCCEAVSPQLCLLIATPIPSQAEQSSATLQTVDLLAQSTLDIWGGQPLPAAPSDASTEPSLDPIWDIERELFAPEPIESDEIVSRRFQATPSAVSPPRPDSPVNATVAAPVEQIAHASMAAQTPAVAASAALPRPMVRPMPRAAPTDPLAALKAMTPEERIALFT